MRRCLSLLLTTPLIPAACGTDAGPAPAGPEVVVDTIGDTTVVRTLSGSLWEGEATLVPDIAIGELDGPEEYFLGRISSIAVNMTLSAISLLRLIPD